MEKKSSPFKVKRLRTIDNAFRDFLLELSSSFSEFKVTQSHLASIESCLRDNFGLSRFFRTGSFCNKTSISGYSDVDYFACIYPEKLSKSSGIALNQLCNALARKFSTISVYVDCPAIKIIFGRDGRESMEIVPAQYLQTTENGYFIYAIPDCLNGWRKASPEIYDAYVREVDQSLDGKVKPLIRFIKAWKYYHHVPISSFYLELGVTRYAESKRTIIYDVDIQQFFLYLNKLELCSIHDPMGISGYTIPCSTKVQLINALSKLSKAVSLTEQALEAKEKGNIREAFDWWNLLYNGRFPSYYR